MSASSILSITCINHYFFAMPHKSPHKKLFYKLLKHVQWITEKFPIKIRNIFGGTNHMIDFPVVIWQNKFIASTDYIDNIHPEDVSAPVSVGQDVYDRPFICLRFRFSTNTNSNKPPLEMVETLFQRYTDDSDFWTNGCQGSGLVRESSYWYRNGSFVHQFTHSNLERLLQNKGHIEYERLTPKGYQVVERCANLF